MQRPEQRVVVQPPGLLVAERAEGRRAARSAGPFRVAEMRERAPQRRPLQRRGPRRSRSSARARAHRALRAIRGSQRGFAADRLEVFERPHRDELRIDRHRAQRRIRRRLARRHFVDGQQLQHALPGAHRATAPAARCRRFRRCPSCVVEGIENSGTRIPARRDPAAVYLLSRCNANAVQRSSLIHESQAALEGVGKNVGSTAN